MSARRRAPPADGLRRGPILRFRRRTQRHPPHPPPPQCRWRRAPAHPACGAWRNASGRGGRRDLRITTVIHTRAERHVSSRRRSPAHPRDPAPPSPTGPRAARRGLCQARRPASDLDRWRRPGPKVSCGVAVAPGGGPPCGAAPAAAPATPTGANPSVHGPRAARALPPRPRAPLHLAPPSTRPCRLPHTGTSHS